MKLRRCLILVISLVLPVVSWSFIGAESAESTESTVWICPVQDTINPMVSEYLNQMITQAELQAIDCLIIELDTPGGVLDSTHAIVQKEMNARIPIVVYVSPQGARAASAGMFITIASHIAAMATATNIGAAHPVSLGPMSPGPPELPESVPLEKEPVDRSVPGKMTDGSAMEQKIMNDTLAWARTIAQNRNRNMDWVESAIVESISSTEQEALEAGVIDLVCRDRNDLIKALHGRHIMLPQGEIKLNVATARIIEKPMTFRQRLLSVIINPTIAIYLLFGGLIGLYIELTHPGFILPGVFGAISLILALFAMHTLPINYAGLFLLLLSFAFFIAEVKVQSYGILSIGGIVALLLGASMLIDSEISGLEVSMGAILPLAIAVAGITVFLVSLVVKSHTRKTITGNIGMIGLTGTVKAPLDPEGQVFVHGEIWRAKSADGRTIPAGSSVEIVSSRDLTLFVRRKDNEPKEDNK